MKTEEIIKQQLTEAEDYLKQYNLSVVYNDKYDFTGKPWVAVYQHASVRRNGKIKIGLNLEKIKKSRAVKREVAVSIWHEIGHGLVDWLKQNRRKDTQNKTGKFSGQCLKDFREILSDEEYVVEQFGRYIAGYAYFSELEDFLDRYEFSINN